MNIGGGVTMKGMTFLEIFRVADAKEWGQLILGAGKGGCNEKT